MKTKGPTHRPAASGPSADASEEVSAPIRSLTTVAFAAGLYGLLVLMTVVYELSLGGGTP